MFIAGTRGAANRGWQKLPPLFLLVLQPACAIYLCVKLGWLVRVVAVAHLAARGLLNGSQQGRPVSTSWCCGRRVQSRTGGDGRPGAGRELGDGVGFAVDHHAMLERSVTRCRERAGAKAQARKKGQRSHTVHLHAIGRFVGRWLRCSVQPDFGLWNFGWQLGYFGVGAATEQHGEHH